MKIYFYFNGVVGLLISFSLQTIWSRMGCMCLTMNYILNVLLSVSTYYLYTVIDLTCINASVFINNFIKVIFIIAKLSPQKKGQMLICFYNVLDHLQNFVFFKSSVTTLMKKVALSIKYISYVFIFFQMSSIAVSILDKGDVG